MCNASPTLAVELQTPQSETVQLLMSSILLTSRIPEKPSITRVHELMYCLTKYQQSILITCHIHLCIIQTP